MPAKKQQTQIDANTELLRDLLITELAKADVPQLEIRRIVGCDIHKVSRIAKHIRSSKQPG